MQEANVHRIGTRGRRFLEAFKSFHQVHQRCEVACARPAPPVPPPPWKAVSSHAVPSACMQVHQWWHVVFGPCTSLCNHLPDCDSNGCEMLLPLHAGYDLLLRAWATLHHPSLPQTGRLTSKGDDSGGGGVGSIRSGGGSGVSSGSGSWDTDSSRVGGGTSDLCVEDPTLDFELEGCLPYLFPLRSVRDECGHGYAGLPYEYDGLLPQWVEPARQMMAAQAASLSSSQPSA